jgi:hypothetical protein
VCEPVLIDGRGGDLLRGGLTRMQRAVGMDSAVVVAGDSMVGNRISALIRSPKIFDRLRESLG